MKNERKMPYRAKAGQGDTLSIVASILGAAAIDPAKNYSEQLFEVLRLAIARTRLAPGTVLSEAGIAEASGLSRTPVREALRQLAQEGLVDVYPQAGTVVAPIRVSLLDDARFVRAALEAANFSAIARGIGEADLDSLASVVEAQRKAMEGEELGTFMDLDDAFHAAAFSVGGRPRVWDLIDRGKIHLDRVRWLLLERLAAHAPRVLADHEELVAFLGRHDGAGAAELARVHVEKVAVDLLELRAALPPNYFAD